MPGNKPILDLSTAPPAAAAAPAPDGSATAPTAAPEPLAAGAGTAVTTTPSSPTSTVPAQPEAHEKVVTNLPSILTAVPATRKHQWEAEHGGFIASRLAISRRLTAWPEQLLSPRESLPRGREEFLWRVARDTWTGLQAYTDRDSGLVVDNVRIVGGLVPPLALKVGDYTNITNVGLQLAAIVAARRLGLIDDDDAREWTVRIIDTLETLKRFDGYFFNYYDTTSLEPTSSFLSFVDTGWLVAGLMIARQGFPDLQKSINELLEPIDLHWFYDDSSGLMSHGYYASLGALSAYEYGSFFTEARLGSLIAIGKGDAPPSHWYAMHRASKPGCVDGECPELNQLAWRSSRGQDMTVAYFRWRSYEYVPSWGGSMFEALMPRLVLDEGRWAPRSLGPNGQAHALLQKYYATQVLGYPVWGMSPCIDPNTGRYHEYGMKALGSHGYDETVVTAHAAALALAVSPDDAAEDLMDLAKRYDMYGPFGFYDSVVPDTGRVAYDQLALDQLMLFLSVANYLSGGYVPALFAEDPWVKDALPLLAEERFFN
ncbi:MAG TPA: glucoamylase family protein [Candidatus Binatia bacterium]